MNDLFLLGVSYGEPITLRMAVVSLLLAFVLAKAVGATYVWTFRGMSYSQSFVHALPMGAIVTCMLMLAVNTNIAAGLGIAGTLAMIRFRTSMRDPRDMVFVFAALGAGIATGLRAYGAAVFGIVLFCAAVFLLVAVEFGSQQKFDGLLRFQLPLNADESHVAQVLKRHTRHFALVTLREAAQGEVVEHAYQVQLAQRTERSVLIRDLEAIPGLNDVSLLLQERTVEL